MHCCLWFRSVFRVRGPWPKRYGYHLSIIIFCIFILHRILRTKQVGKLLLHVCLALTGVYVTFLLAMHGEYYQQILGFCYTVSGLLQYFLLVYLFWTAVESFHICLKLVKVFGTDISNFFWKAAVIAWGKNVIVHFYSQSRQIYEFLLFIMRDFSCLYPRSTIAYCCDKCWLWS